MVAESPISGSTTVEEESPGRSRRSGIGVDGSSRQRTERQRSGRPRAPESSLAPQPAPLGCNCRRDCRSGAPKPEEWPQLGDFFQVEDTAHSHGVGGHSSQSRGWSPGPARPHRRDRTDAAGCHDLLRSFEVGIREEEDTSVMLPPDGARGLVT